jgi:beta-phosphoglucomutase
MNKGESLAFSTTEYGPSYTGRNETLFTTANGYLGFRGDYEEKEGCVHKGTYINGFYDTEPITYGESAFGYAKNHETILNLPDPKHIELTVNGTRFSTVSDAVQSFKMLLDFRTGIMTRTVLCTLPDGRSYTMRSERLVSFVHKTCAAIRYTVTAATVPSGSLDVTLLSGIDTAAANISADEDPRVGAKFSSKPLIIDSSSAERGTLSFTAHTRMSRLSLTGTVIQILDAGDGAEIKTESRNTETGPYESYSFSLGEGKQAVLTKYISYDTASGSAESVRTFASAGFKKAEEEHRAYLSRFWETAYMETGSCTEDELAVNFNLFHLLQSAGKDGTSSIAAKGLTAEGYEGHYFWDTEAYVCPVFTYVQPDIAQSLLAYRARILPLAKKRAEEMSMKGALFPWRTISGNETSAYFPAGTAQYHIDADIMFALNKYLTAAGMPQGETERLSEKDICSIAVETARMWISLGSFIPEKGGAFCINEVTGPDEYTACVNNNAYTNLMARENLRTSILIAERYHAVSGAETAQWKRAADSMYIPFDESAGIYPQDDSFMEKADWDFAHTPKENYPLLLHYHPLVIYRYRVLKQPDLVLAQFLLSGQFTRAEKIRNFLFYEKYTTGDSSLSHCIQCIAACEASDIPKAVSYFNKTARMDIADINGNTNDGIHTACMAGSWMAVVYGFAGFRDYGGRWSFNPQLPEKWTNLSFSLRILGMRLEVRFTKDEASYTLHADGCGQKGLALTHRNVTFLLHDGQTETFSLRPSLKAVLFDLDGVITNTAELHYRAWKTIAEKHGLSFNKEISAEMSGRSRADSLELLLRKNNAEWTAEEKDAAADEKNKLYVSSLASLSSADILPGIQKLLEQLRQKHIKCVLASASRNAPFILEKLGIASCFDAVVDPALLQKGKPEPDIYIKAAELSGKWYTDCIGIEDAQSGIDAVKKAGIRAAGVGRMLHGADVLVDDTAGLTFEVINF